MSNFFTFLNRHRWFGLFLMLLSIVITSFGLPKVKANLEVSRIFLKQANDNAPAMSAEKFSVIFLRLTSKQSTIFNRLSLNALKNLINDLKKIGNGKDVSNIQKVSSILSAKTLENGQDGLRAYPLLKSTRLSASEAKIIEHRVRSSKLVMQDLVSKDYKKTTLVLQYKSRGRSANLKMSDQIDEILHHYKGSFSSSIHVSQDRVTSQTLKTIAKQGPLLVGAALLIMLLFIAIMTKDVRVVLLCSIVMLLNLVLSMGLIGFCGLSINLVSLCVPVIIVVLGSTEAVHMVCGYLKGMEHHKNDPVKALEYMISKVYFSTMMTSATTIVGFLSFAISSSYAIREFGYEGAIAMVVCGIVSLFFIPVLLAFISLRHKAKSQSSALDHTNRKPNFVDYYSRFVIKNATFLLVILAVVFMSSLYVASRCKTDMAIFEAFTAKHPVTVDLKRLRGEFGGIAMMRVVVTSTEPDVFLTPDALNKLHRFTRNLSQNKLISSSVSIADVVANFNRKLHDDSDKYDAIPENEDALEQLTSMIDFDNFHQFINSDFNKATILVRFSVTSKYDVEQMMKEVSVDFQKTMGDGFQFHVVSKFNKYFEAIDLLVKEGGLSALFCLGLIFLMFCFQYANVKSGLIAFSVNLFPVVLLVAFMSLFHFPIDPISITAIIIVLSVGVDDTIHFFTKFAKFSRHTDTVNGAIVSTIDYEITPVVATSFAIFLAMMVLSLSSVKFLFTLGFLVAVGMIFAFLSDMLVSPILLSKFRIISLLDLVVFRYNTDVLKSAPIFKNMSTSQIKKAVLLSQVVHLTPGEQLIKQGEPGDSMYIVLDGELDICRDSKNIAKLKPGNVVGEMAYFSEENRTADVFADGDVSLVVFNEKAQRHSMRFQKKMYLRLMRNAITIILKRLNQD